MCYERRRAEACVDEVQVSKNTNEKESREQSSGELCLQDCLFKLACSRVIDHLLIGLKRSCAAKEANTLFIGKTRYLCIGMKRFRANQEGRDNITGRLFAPEDNPLKISAPPPCDATPWFLYATPGSPESPVTRAAEAQILTGTLVQDPPAHAWIWCVLDSSQSRSAPVNPKQDHDDDSTDHLPPFSVRQYAPPPAPAPDATPTAPFSKGRDVDIAVHCPSST
jgi:hypothetical protein